MHSKCVLVDRHAERKGCDFVFYMKRCRRSVPMHQNYEERISVHDARCRFPHAGHKVIGFTPFCFQIKALLNTVGHQLLEAGLSDEVAGLLLAASLDIAGHLSLQGGRAATQSTIWMGFILTLALGVLLSGGWVLLLPRISSFQRSEETRRS